MQFNKFVSAITRTERAGINENWEKIERGFSQTASDLNEAHDKATEALSKSNQAVSTSNTARDTAQRAEVTAEYVQSQLDDVVVSGDNIEEVVQARGGKKNLRERLDKENEKSKLSFIKNRQNHIQANSNLKASVLFVDDDMRSQAYTVLFKDYVEQRGLPWTFAAVKSWIGTSGNATLAQFKEMAKHPLVNIANHTTTHPQLSTLTAEEQEREIAECEAWLLEQGIYTRCLVPPQGMTNEDTRRIAKKYVDTILVTTTADAQTTSVNCANGDFLHSHRVRRIDLSHPLELLKQHVDLAVATNALLVIATHAWYTSDETANPTHNFNTAKLDALLDYINSVDIEIVDYETAYDRFKNVIEHRKDDSVLVHGIAASGKKAGFDFAPNLTERIHANDTPNQLTYPYNTRTVHTFNTGNATTYGYPMAGILVTQVGGDFAFVNQTLRGIRSNKILYRTWNDQTQTWADWQDLAVFKNKKGVFTFGTNYEDIPPSTIVVHPVNIGDLQVGDNLVITPNGDNLPYGLMCEVYNVADGVARISFYNANTINASINGLKFSYAIL